jgi:diguanylate cyclase (GGDEF)-like protein
MKKRVILIVDDERPNRLILKKQLEDTYDLLEATGGREALEVLRANTQRISAVLLDILMPDMDGYEVMHAMNAEPELSKIPVIVSSQKGGDEAEALALSCGAQDFIAKPYKAEIIRHRLANLIKFRETAALINRAEFDELTGLYNKPFFTEKVSDHLRHHPDERFDLMCIGIERFHLINEAYGTKQGDALLRYIADLLREAKRPLYSARFSADLFVLLLPHRDNYEDSTLAQWYARVNEFPINMDVKLHCGIYAITPEDAEVSVNVLCDRAQSASIKNKGMYDTLFYVYDDALRQKLLDEQFVTGNMRLALKEQQYQVYYQPKYDLRSERIAGVEALVRWIHPERGMIMPGVFIPILERSGFISELDHYVWDVACRDIRRWMDAGLPPIAVSVNVSRADLYDPTLSSTLLTMLQKYEVPIRFLHLEITESAYTNNPEQIIQEVGRLRALGFIVEMDDFGSGYSSLNMLAMLPVDVLKLDIRFIQAESARISGKGVLSFVISLAKWLNLAVVAEGVETGEQIAMLRSMDCTYVQGFYYARPMRREDLEALLRDAHTTEMVSPTGSHPSAAPALAASGKRREMLIVDDMEFNRAVLAGNFDGVYTVVEKENGGEAWEYLCAHYADVEIVMLDLLMPVMDGFQLLDKIRGDERMRELPVIITSQGDAASEGRALRMGADDFISKPYNPDIIRHRVANVLAGYRLRALERKSKTEE